MENYPECVLSLKYVLPQYIEIYREQVKLVKNGADQVEFTIQIYYPDYTVHWVRYRMNTMGWNGNDAEDGDLYGSADRYRDGAGGTN